MGKKKILVVDDDVDFVETTKIVLEAHNFDVITAYDGAAGLQKAKKEHPDLMLLDVMMASDSEGFEVARKIPESPELRNMPVVLVTGIREAKHLSYKFEPDETWLPVNRVLEKPVPPEKLIAEVNRALEKKRA
jgi:CheY-like chemotaxis protein